MATKHDKTALADALAGLADTHPDLAGRLGSDPSRADLLAALGDIAPGAAAGARQMSRAGLVAVLAITPSNPDPDPLVTFTTRVPEGLAQEVKTRAIARGCSIQALVADYLRAGLAGDDKGTE